jgi:hypothetical protein
MHKRMDDRDEAVVLGGGQHIVSGGAKGGSLELSLELALVLQIRCGFCLHDLQNEGILTEGPVSNGGQQFELTMVKQLQ